MATETAYLSHSYQHFEDLQMSSMEFYDLLKGMIEAYQYPDVKCALIRLKEEGIFSSSRDYMKITKGLHSYFVCASPFGRSFFISWWFQEHANTAANIVEKIPVIGKAAAQHMESKTLYQLDTELIFKTGITSIIKAAVSKVMADKGFRKETSAIGQ